MCKELPLGCNRKMVSLHVFKFVLLAYPVHFARLEIPEYSSPWQPEFGQCQLLLIARQERLMKLARRRSPQSTSIVLSEN